MNKKLNINLNNYQRIRDIDLFRNDLIELLGFEILNYNTLDQLVYGFLSKIYPINKKLKESDKSVEELSKQLLEHFKFTKSSELFLLYDNGKKLISSDKGKTYKQRVLEI
jgi:hypothetical protein